eukprot:8091828-Alexandrium_andersonii.AAC.1
MLAIGGQNKVRASLPARNDGHCVGPRAEHQTALAKRGQRLWRYIRELRDVRLEHVQAGCLELAWRDCHYGRLCGGTASSRK